MKSTKDIFKCNVCGNVTEKLFDGGGELVCCGQPMEKLIAKKEEEGSEKHKPINNDKLVKVGVIPHPMEEKHYIVWIESITDDGSCRRYLNPGDKPQAEFISESKSVRAYCNIHGLWNN